MKFLELSLPTPAENLACDEALLDWCGEGHGDGVLRVWESPEYFVALGYANPIATETNRDVCEARGVPILRRCTGGGAVVQGPGCLNYALVLEITDAGPLKNITSANRFIMEQNRAALETLLNRRVELNGHTDLTIGGLKFSGNAQRRRKRFLLFHGTFLLDFDLRVITELLSQPSRQPDYRQNRAHNEFLMNLRLPAIAVKNALRAQWNVGEVLERLPLETIRSLVHDRYATTEWNFKF